MWKNIQLYQDQTILISEQLRSHLHLFDKCLEHCFMWRRNQIDEVPISALFSTISMLIAKASPVARAVRRLEQRGCSFMRY